MAIICNTHFDLNSLTAEGLSVEPGTSFNDYTDIAGLYESKVEHFTSSDLKMSIIFEEGAVCIFLVESPKRGTGAFQRFFASWKNQIRKTLVIEAIVNKQFLNKLIRMGFCRFSDAEDELKWTA